MVAEKAEIIVPVRSMRASRTMKKQRTLLKNATLIAGTGEKPLPQSFVLLEGDRIIGVTERLDGLPLDSDQVEIDLTGKFVLPGFINTHDHVATKRVRGHLGAQALVSDEILLGICVKTVLSNLAEGITTIREMGSRNGLSRIMRAMIENGHLIGPRVVIVGRALTATAGYASRNGVEIDSPLEARKAAAQQIKEGADWIKCMASIEWELAAGEPISAVNLDVATMKAAFDVAHHHGKRCAVHAICDEAIANALEAGVNTIEHGIMLSARTAEEMARRGAYLVPTFSGYLEHCNDWGRGEGVQRHGELLRQHHAPGFRNALNAGVKFAYGTDTLGNFVDETRLMLEAGAKPMDCVLAATRWGAELLGLADKIGTVEAGKFADLVVLDNNPLESAAAFGNIHRVIKGGRVLDPRHIPI